MIDKNQSASPSFWDIIKRGRTEIAMLMVVSLAVFFIPPDARMGLLALFITKAAFVTLGVLYAHISRKFLFPYLDMEVVIEKHQWGGMAFLVVYYGVVIWAFAVGG